MIFAKKYSGKCKVHCFICSAEKPLYKMRDHVGKHILWDLRGQPPPPGQVHVNPVGAFPCGFCGMDGCFTQIIDEKKGSKIKCTIQSSCIYHYENMNYKAACKSSKSMPCTNVPIPCSLCPRSLSGDPQTIWKYSTTLHLITEHPVAQPIGPDGRGEVHYMPDIPPDMVVNMFISHEEEQSLGIKNEATIAYREENELPPSDDIAAMGRDLLPDSELNVAKRGRAPTLSVVEPVMKKYRKKK